MKAPLTNRQKSQTKQEHASDPFAAARGSKRSIGKIDKVMIMGQEVIVSPLKGAVNYEHRYYPNGAIEMFWNSQRQYTIYNTGDIVFFWDEGWN
jgi:hypothetical protein